MGVNLGSLAHTLGLGGLVGNQSQSQPQLQQPNVNPGFTMSGKQPQVGTHPLLGAATGELPAVNPQQMAPGAGQNDSPMDGTVPAPQSTPQVTPQGAAPADQDTATVTASPRMSPEALGMPGSSGMRSANPNTVAELRQDDRNRSDMARDRYHHGSEFGTHGLLRDVIGNVEDLGRGLLGFSPRYNDEKWTERAYGMSSTDPNVAAAATEQAMQYNPEKTQAYLKELTGNAATKANSAATTEYKNSQAQGRYANIASGLGSALFASNVNASPKQQQTNYERMKPAIQNALDKVYGEGTMQAPEQYDPNFATQLAQAGYTGNNVQRAQSNINTEDTKMHIAQMSDSTKRALGSASNDTRIRVAQIMASSSLGRAQMELQVRRELGLAPEVETSTESGSIIHPTKQVTRQKGGGGAAPAQSPSGPPIGYRSPQGFIFHGGDPKNPSNWSK